VFPGVESDCTAGKLVVTSPTVRLAELRSPAMVELCHHGTLEEPPGSGTGEDCVWRTISWLPARFRATSCPC
jgi:hypothetical protein